MDKFHECRLLWRKDKNKSKVARELGLDRKTVHKYINGASPPKYSPRSRSTKQDLFKEFESFVGEALKHAPKLSSGELYALIKPRGYKGSERTIQRRMKALKDQHPKERFFEQEYQAGEQSQFDFKEKLTLPFEDGPRIVHLHFSTLPFSGTCIIKAFPHKTYECFMDGVHSFFEKIGGIPKNMRIDNLSPCVRRVYKSGRRDYTESFERAMKYYNIGVLPCNPGRGNEKGDVERDIRTFVKRFDNHVRVHDLKFLDFKSLNRELELFYEREQSEESKQLLEEERHHLLPVIAPDESILCKVDIAGITPLGTVRVRNTTYSVPDEWIGSRCQVVQSAYEVRITRAGSQDVIVHDRGAQGEHSIKLEHVIKSLLRKPMAMVRWQHRHILFTHQVFRRYYDTLLVHHKDITGEAEREFLRTLNLIHFVPLGEIACAVGLVLEQASKNYFDDVRSLLLVERRPSVIDLLPRIKQTPLKPNLKMYDQLIPKGVNQ